MKNLLKKPIHKALGLSVAIAMGSMAVSSVSAVPSMDNLGDLAFVPYYTTNAGFVSGIHITNTTAQTQIVKVRYKLAKNSADGMDFNVLMSPYDEFTGYVEDRGGNLTFVPTDNTCVAPWADNVGAVDGDGNPVGDGIRDPMVAGQRVDSTGAVINPGASVTGSVHGYIEVIGMGQPINEAQQIAKDVLHVAGIPNNCARAASNFHAVRTPTEPALVKNVPFALAAVVADFKTDPTSVGNTVNDTGVVTFSDTVAVMRAATDADSAIHAVSQYEDTPGRALRVSYFIRDKSSGLEFGNSADHFEDFASEAMMTNQEYSVTDYTQGIPLRQSKTGYELPNLMGGSTVNGATIALNNFGPQLLDAINLGYGAAGVGNDWVASTDARGLGTDWVITFPGQNLQSGGSFPSIPVTTTAFNREEGRPTAVAGLVVSPSDIGQAPQSGMLTSEVNVVTWQVPGSSGKSVLGATSNTYKVTLTDSVYALDASGASTGWANLTFENVFADVTQPTVAATPATSAQNVAIVAEPYSEALTVDGEDRIPTLGFTAWAREFASLPAASYGRIVEHSRLKTAK